MAAGDLREVVVRLARQLRHHADSASLSVGALSALGALGRHGEMTVGDLARHEQVTPPMITKIARQLSEQGLVERQADPDDGRVTRLRASASGKALIDRRGLAGTTYLATKLEDMTEDDLRSIEAALPALRRLAAFPDVDGEGRR